MTDDRYDADGELLSAWLAGDLDPQGSEELERRLSAEPELVTRLDRIHDTVAALRGLDDVVPPPGASQRLRERLERERPPAPVASLDRARERRRSRLPALAAAAAVVAVVALIPVLSNLSGQGGGESGQVAARDAPQLNMEDAAGGGGEEAAGDDTAQFEAETASSEAAAAPAPAAAPTGPVIVETDLDLQAERSADEEQALLGLPVADARQLGVDYAAAIAAAPPFASLGVEPGACLDAVLSDLQVEVPARVEGFRQGDRTVLEYTLVFASPGSDVLDTSRVTRVDATTCTPA
jgi:anti-sigma factor RsiW